MVATEQLIFDILARDNASAALLKTGASADKAGQSVAALTRRLEEVSRQSVAARVGIDGDVAANATLDKLQARLITLGRQTANPNITVEGTARAAAQIAAIEAELGKLGDTQKEVASPGWVANLAAAAAVVNKPLGRGGWFGTLAGFHIPLFAGALTKVGLPAILGTASGLHLLSEAVIETTAVVVPATIALGAFGVGAAPTVRDIYDQMKNLYTISKALNVQMPGMTGGFSKMVAAVQPQVYSLFGDALDIINHKGGGLQTMATGAGSALDRLGARFELAVTSGNGMTKFANNAVTDLSKLGDIIGNLGGTFGNLLHVMPGFAGDLLNIADAGTRVLETVTRIAAPIIGFGLSLHGTIFYAGLLATALVKLGTTVVPRVGLAAISAGTKFGLMGEGSLKAAKGLGATDHQLASIADNLGGVIGAQGFAKVGTEAEQAAGRTGLFGKALGILTKVPVWGWVAVGAAALGGLIFWLATSKDATQKWLDSLQANISGQKTFTGVTQATVSAIEKINEKLAVTPKYVVSSADQMARFGGSVDVVNRKYTELSDGVRKYSAEGQTEQSRLAQLTTMFGSTGAALALFNKLGIKASDIAGANASQWKNDIQQLHGYLTAVTTLAGYQGGRALAAQQAMTKAQSDQLAAVQQVTQAEDSYITILTGGEQAFTTFAQDLQQTTKDQNAGKVSTQALAQAHSSLASAQSRVASAQSSLSSLQKSGTATSAQLHAAQASLTSANTNLAAVQGKVQTATHGTTVSLGGLNSASLKFASDFWSSLFPAAQKQIDALDAQFIGTKQLTKATATIAKQMLPYAKGNDAARVAIMDLINNALGPGTVSMKTLNKWVGQNSTSMQGYKSIVDKTLVAASQLAKGLQNDLNVQFHQALLKTSGADGALKTYTADLVHNRQNTATGHADRAALIRDLEKSGLSAKQATTYVDGLNRSLGKTVKGSPYHAGVTVTGSGSWQYVQGSTAGHRVGPGGQGFATGGMIPGPDLGHDSQIIAVRGGEGVLVPGAVHLLGGPAALHALNRMAETGARSALRHFATGGIIPHYAGSVAGETPWETHNTAVTINRMIAAMTTAAQSVSGLTGAGASGPVAALAKRMAAARGWTGNQWLALNSVEMAEAGWNLSAQNPGSGAYGIAQFINGPGEYAQYGGSLSAAGQVTAFLNYVAQRYGNPEAAWAHEQQYHWYAGGTGGAAPGWAWVGEEGPELVRFTGGEQVLPHADSVAAGMSTHGYVLGTLSQREAAVVNLLQRLANGETKASTVRADQQLSLRIIARYFRGADRTRFENLIRQQAGTMQQLLTEAKNITPILRAERGYAGSVQKSLRNYTPNLLSPTSGGAIESELKGRLSLISGFGGDIRSLSQAHAPARIIRAFVSAGPGGAADTIKQYRAFGVAVKKLQNRGLHGELISEIINLGAADGLKVANEILAGGSGLIHQLTGTEAAIKKATGQVGRGAASSVYGAGYNASTGFLNGLQKQRSAFYREAGRWGDAMGKELARWLGIPRSKWPVSWHASGMDAVISKPTLIGVGEAGPERVNVTPLSSGGGGTTGPGITVNGGININHVPGYSTPKDVEEALAHVQRRFRLARV